MSKGSHDQRLTVRERFGLRRSARKGRGFGIDRGRFLTLRVIGTFLIAIPVLLLFAGIVRFVSMPLTQAWALGAYSNEQYEDTKSSTFSSPTFRISRKAQRSCAKTSSPRRAESLKRR